MVNAEICSKGQTGIFDIKAAVSGIEAVISNINTNQDWLQFLSFQARFYDYSINNTLLIFLQFPTATFVAGYSKWKSMGRFVKRGEKAIKIIAPCKYQIEKEVVENGISQTKTYQIIKGFRLVNVFDFSQTDGESSTIPTAVIGLQRSDAAIQAVYNAIKKLIPIPVAEICDINVHGYYMPHNKSIAVKSTLSDAQKLKTLIHEYSHHLHLTKYFDDETRSVAEVIAESSAYVVMQFLGIDTSSYSIPYINSWADDLQTLRTIGDKTQKIAAEIINLVGKPLESASAEREVY